MNNGRWYPTAITLPDESVLVLSGSFLDPARNAVANNVVPQIWSNGNFTSIAPIPDAAFDLYPRMHVASTGLVYLTSLVQNLVAGRLGRRQVDGTPRRHAAQRVA